MGEYADYELDRIMESWSFGRTSRARATTCHRCGKRYDPGHQCRLDMKKRFAALAKPKPPEMSATVRSMLIDERAARIMLYDDAYPDVGPGMSWAVAYMEAEQQLIKEGKIP